LFNVEKFRFHMTRFSDWFSSTPRTGPGWGHSGSTTATAAHARDSHGFGAMLSHLAQASLDLLWSFFHSVIALFHFTWALLSDATRLSYNIVAGITSAMVSVVNSIFDTTFHLIYEATHGTFNLFSGVIGFIAGNILAISIVIGGYYLYTSYQRQTSAARTSQQDDGSTASSLAGKTISDASAHAQRDAQAISAKASQAAHRVWDGTNATLRQRKQEKNEEEEVGLNKASPSAKVGGVLDKNDLGGIDLDEGIKTRSAGPASDYDRLARVIN